MTTASEPPKGLTVPEVAGQLSLTPDQVRDLIAAGALTATGSGDDTRIAPESVLMYTVSRLRTTVERATARPRPLATASAVLLPLLLALWFMAACVEVFSLRGKKPIAPVPIAVLVLLAVLAFLWWLARQADEFSSTNGLGTTIYGRRMTPEGRVGTQWLIIAGVPLLPLRSYVILEKSDETSNWSGAIRKTNLRVRSLDRIYWPQALPILCGVWAGLAGLVALAVLTG